jgi:hypothetical protein
MNEQRNDRLESVTRALATRPEAAGFSLRGILEKLPSWALVPLTVVVFGLLLTDAAVADPVPFVDEAALFYALLTSMKVLGARRKAAKEIAAIERGDESVFDVDFDGVDGSVLAPGQPRPLPSA